MSADPIPGRSLVTRRAVRDLVHTAVLTVYGVTGFAGNGPAGRLLERIGLAHPGLRVEVEPALRVELRLTVAYGLPIAEVARQVESSVRYTLRHALGEEPDTVVIRIGKLVHLQSVTPVEVLAPAEPSSSELAASGTDVA